MTVHIQWPTVSSRQRAVIWVAGIGMALAWRLMIAGITGFGIPHQSIHWLFAMLMGAWAMDRVEELGE